MCEQQPLAAWLAIHRTPGVGPVTFQKLLAENNSPQQILDNPWKLESVDRRIQQALQDPDWQQVEADLQWLEQPDRWILTLQDELYPALLREIPDPPPLLYLQGNPDLLNSWQLAMVGSRNPTASGRQTAQDFASYLAAGGLTVTSGLATGIDAAAHQGALRVHGLTIAVVGTGLDRVYPAKHRDLAHEIAHTGLLVSEFPLGTPPKAENFPRRNRIISGLSLGTLIIEAALRSGSLITARMAMEQGREVFAIPGSIHNPLARGCHQLIREGAKLVETAEHIVEELGALAGVRFAPDNVPSPTQNTDLLDNDLPDDDYQILFEHLGFDPIHIDQLIADSGLTADAVSSMLLLLELQGQVASMPGGRYVRNGSPGNH